jgi:hypothetical protein
LHSKILLISPEFYGFENEIQAGLRSLGYDVFWINNKEMPFDYHSTGSKLKILRKIYFFLYFPQIRYLRHELYKLNNPRFDILFSINCHVTCPYLFSVLKRKNPKIRSILFLWDSLSMYSWEKEIKYFNEVYTFNQVDSEKMKIRYKPNFFIENTNSSNDQDYDLFFAGKFSYYRLLILDRLMEKFEKTGIKSCIKLWPAYRMFFHNVIIFQILKKLNSSNLWMRNYVYNYEAVTGILDRSFIIMNKLSYEEIQSYASGSNVILDLPFKSQTGYSHRLINALANGKKILTTNECIMSEIFYNPEQIKVIKSIDSDISLDWIFKKSNFDVPHYIRDLELTQWLKSVLNVEFS